MFLIEFFRDFLSGFVYIIYLAICIFAFFYVFGIVADRKRHAIEKKLKEKKTYDIESGKEAAIAAMETKQVLDVDDSMDSQGSGTDNQNATLNSALNSMSHMPDATQAQKDEAPNVMVLNSGDSKTNETTQTSEESTNPQIKPPEEQGPVVIDSSSLEL